MAAEDAGQLEPDTVSLDEGADGVNGRNGAAPAGHGASGMKFFYSNGARPLDGYTIKRGIGVGGFGEVYYAVSDAGKEVALKRVQRNHDVELRGVTQCLNLKHPNLVVLYDIRHDPDGEAWVVMEYIAGPSLKDVLTRHPQGIPREEVLRWFRGIAAAVACLHDHGIVHRDLKPANIFDDHGTVKVGDYGLSKYITCSRRAGNTESVGTCHYMAPEIGKGRYGKEVDIYALGVILYEMLTGRVPFDGESVQEVMMKHLVDEPDLSALSEPFRPVIRCALAKDPARRFSSVAEMVAALEAATAGQPEIVFVERPNAPADPRPQGGGAINHQCRQDDIVFGPVRTHPPASPRGMPRPPPPGTRPAVTRTPPPPRSYRGVGSLTWLAIALIGLIFLAVAAPPLGPVFLLAIGALVTAVLVPFILSQTQLAFTRRAVDELKKAELVRRREQARALCRSESWFTRTTQLLDSWLLSSGWCLLLSVVSAVLLGEHITDRLQLAGVGMWLFIHSTVASWLVLLLGKTWQGRNDTSSRRPVMLAVGVVLGVLAWLANRVLPLPSGNLLEFPWEPLLAVDKLSSFIIYFSALMAVPRWWKFVDPLRTRRFALWPTIWATAWGWLAHGLVPFPFPIGVLLAAVIAVAVQMSSRIIAWQYDSSNPAT